MPFDRVIVMGASAGGVEALRAVVAGLPPDLPCPVLVVLHVPRTGTSALPGILSRSGPLPATHALDGEELREGHIFVAPGDHHLLVLDGRARLTHGPTENGHRPAVDPLFRSAARAYGAGAIGVVLSGSRDDGAAGILAIGRSGGITVTQDPDDTLYPWMPLAAAEYTHIDHVAPAAKLGPLLGEQARLPVAAPPRTADPLLDAEVEQARLSPLSTDEIDGAAEAGLGCPSCGGALWRLGAGQPPRFRCRVGHAWSPESLLEQQAGAVESALWVALRALTEKSALGRQMADHPGRRHNSLGRRYADMADEAEHAAALIRRLIGLFDGPVEHDPSRG